MKFDIDPRTHAGTQQQRRLFRSYLEGLQWVLHYYYRGPDRCSWSWFYPYYHAPMASDLINFDEFPRLELDFDVSEPFAPFQQLMGVLPAASKGLLPECYQWLFDSRESPILDTYPRNFEIDMDGVKVPWGGVALIPFIKVDSLLGAMREAELRGKPLTAAERKRNSVGVATEYRRDLSQAQHVDSTTRHFAALQQC